MCTDSSFSSYSQWSIYLKILKYSFKWKQWVKWKHMIGLNSLAVSIQGKRVANIYKELGTWSASTVVSRYKKCSLTCVCFHPRPCLQWYAISVTSSFTLSICFSASQCPGVEGEEITQRAQAEFSRTKNIWVKVTQWNSVGSAALYQHQTTKLATRRFRLVLFLWKETKRVRERRREGGREFP